MIDKIVSDLENRAIAGNKKRIKEILEVRRIWEPEVAARAAKSIDPKDLALLGAILDTQEKGLAEGREDAREDLRFHMTLAHATKNDVIVEVTAVIYEILKECRVPPLESLTRKKMSLEGHRAIYAALVNRDSESSREAMLNHLNEVHSFLYGQDQGCST